MNIDYSYCFIIYLCVYCTNIRHKYNKVIILIHILPALAVIVGLGKPLETGLIGPSWRGPTGETELM